VHDIGIVLAGENVPSPSHVCRELIDFIEAPVDHFPNGLLIPKVTLNEIIGLSVGKFGEL
jgi:hypothetical protein